MCVVYVLRTGLMNSAQPLNSSIMMDFTPRSSRARWQSLQSIVRFGWCGSAAIGGVLADRFGYSFTFLITAGIQLAGTTLQLFLLPLVPRQEGLDKQRDAPPGSSGLQPLQMVAAAEPDEAIRTESPFMPRGGS